MWFLRRMLRTMDSSEKMGGGRNVVPEKNVAQDSSEKMGGGRNVVPEKNVAHTMDSREDGRR